VDEAGDDEGRVWAEVQIAEKDEEGCAQRILRSALVGDARPEPPAALCGLVPRADPPQDRPASAAAAAAAEKGEAKEEDQDAMAEASWAARRLLSPGRLLEYRRPGHIDWVPAVVLQRHAWGLGAVSASVQGALAALPPTTPQPERAALFMHQLSAAAIQTGAGAGEGAPEEVVQQLHAARERHMQSKLEGGLDQHKSISRLAAAQEPFEGRTVVCSVLRLTDYRVGFVWEGARRA